MYFCSGAESVSSMPSLTRRDVLRTGGAALAATTFLAGCSSSCPDSDRPSPEKRVGIRDSPAGPFDAAPSGSWPELHGNAANTGYADAGPPDGAVTLRWRTDLSLPDTDSGGLSASSPVVRDGLVAVADSARVHALDVTTGAHRWQSDPISPTDRDTIYEYEANTATPAIGADGTVYVGTTDGVVALDATDGQVRWRFDDLARAGAPTVVDDTVYVAGSVTVAALAVSDGRERWTRQIAWDPALDPPAVGDGVVVVPADGATVGLDAASGDQRWRADVTAHTYAVVDDGTAFVGNGSGGLHAIDLATGEIDWTFSRGEYRELQTPVVTPDSIYVVEQPGEAGAATFALDRRDRKPRPRWCSDVGSGAVVAATQDLAFGIVPLGEGPSSSQGIVAFTSDLGDAPWALSGVNGPRGWVTAPAFLDGAMIATTRGGTVVAVGAQSTDGGGD